MNTQDWEEIGKKIISVGLPILGNAVLPGSGTAISLLTNALGLNATATPAQVTAAISDPANLLKLQELQNNHEEVLAKIAYDAESRNVESINKTLQTEAMGGDWLQRNHHAIESLGTVALIWAVYFFLPLFRVPVPTIPETAWLTLGAILGVTAWMRGQANVATAKKET